MGVGHTKDSKTALWALGGEVTLFIDGVHDIPCFPLRDDLVRTEPMVLRATPVCHYTVQYTVDIATPLQETRTRGPRD